MKGSLAAPSKGWKTDVGGFVFGFLLEPSHSLIHLFSDPSAEELFVLINFSLLGAGEVPHMHCDPCWQNLTWTYRTGRCIQNRRGGMIQIFIQISSCICYSSFILPQTFQLQSKYRLIHWAVWVHGCLDGL